MSESHSVKVYPRYSKGRSGKVIVIGYAVRCTEDGEIGPLFLPTRAGKRKANLFSGQHSESPNGGHTQAISG